MGIHRPTHLLKALLVVGVAPDEDGDSAVVGSPQRGPGSTTAIATSARNTGASVAPLTAGQVVPAAAILAVIVMLSAAITGRLRLRRLRR